MPIIRIKSNAGLTLVELMIAVSLLGIISLGMVGVFGTVSKGIQFSKDRTLATNLCQEQMQILKQKSFNQVLLTTATVYLPSFSPQIPYDAGYYPPETILEGGIYFTRYTYVQVADENSDTLIYPNTSIDTGMKAITVTVTWTQGTDLKKIQIRSILANINATAANANFNGRVTYSTDSATGIPGALVTIAENVGWQDYTNSLGYYQINLNPGSYRIIATARGFFSEYVNASVAVNSNAVQNFSLVAMGSGTVQGTAWINNQLVISQIVGSAMDSAGFCDEFVEIFNPSTFTWTIGSGISSNIDLRYQPYGQPATTIAMTYNNTTIQPSSYYIFANTGTVTVGGVSVTADAVYSPTNIGFPDLLATAGGSCGSGSPDADSVGIAYTGGAWIDRVGWTVNAHAPALYEGTPIIRSSPFQDGEQFVRKTSTSGVMVGPGRAYDSGSNNIDFVDATPAIYPPRNSGNMDTVISGVPAIGAVVTATDGLAQSAIATSVGSPPYALFQLTSVATGTWNVVVTSGAVEMEYSSVTVTANSVTNLPNATSVPTWPVAGYSAVILSSAVTQGYVSGSVTDGLGIPIAIPASGIPVSGGGVSVNASASNGIYFLRVASGTYDVTANPNNVSSTYISQTSSTVNVQLGRITSDVNFVLSSGGRIGGFVTRDGINALSSVVVIGNDTNDITRDQEVSNSSGRFLLINLSTGQYTVEPVLEAGESSTPSSAVVTVTPGTTVFAGTFTVAGVFGTVSGNVTLSGAPIQTGVLILCTTTTVPATPPALSSMTMSGAGYYLNNSHEDGTYSIDVVGSTSTNYKMYAYYTSFTGSVASTTVRTLTNVSITAGNTTSGMNFAW